MGAKVEIGWVCKGDDGDRRHVCARHFGGEWTFYQRPKRKGKDVRWEPVLDPALSDWLELHEAMERRVARSAALPHDLDRIRQRIRERFGPEALAVETDLKADRTEV